MAIATIRAVWRDDTHAYAAAVVGDGGRRGNVEYNASTPLKKDDGSDKSNAELKADLTTALKAVRDAQSTSGLQAIAGISGNVNV